MKIEITQTKKNPLLFREEVEFKVIDSATTPKRTELLEKISAHTNKDKKAIVIKEVKTEFGSKETTGKAAIYESEEKMKKIEAKYMIERTHGKEEKKEVKKEEGK
ncbi:MAG: 30S ribosomal protein S24e [Candidatus Diapherotrites archaeon]|nr:30S ribosomal protein S24e [Candidatus Diapherotrites archaeon]